MYQVPTFYTLRNPRNIPDKIFKLMVTMTWSKVKSRLHHDVAHLQPLCNIPTKYQLPTLYSFQDIAWTKFYRSRSLWEGQTMFLAPPKQCSHHVSTSYNLQFPRYSLDKIFKLKVTMARSNQDIAYLHPLTNIPTMYQLPTPYGF